MVAHIMQCICSEDSIVAHIMQCICSEDSIVAHIMQCICPEVYIVPHIMQLAFFRVKMALTLPVFCVSVASVQRFP